MIWTLKQNRIITTFSYWLDCMTFTNFYCLLFYIWLSLASIMKPGRIASEILEFFQILFAIDRHSINYTVIYLLAWVWKLLARGIGSLHSWICTCLNDNTTAETVYLTLVAMLFLFTSLLSILKNIYIKDLKQIRQLVF